MFAKMLVGLIFGILDVVAPPLNALHRWWTNDKSGRDPRGDNYWTRMFRKTKKPDQQ